MRPTFSERYGRLRDFSAVVRERPEQISEDFVQCIWYDQLFNGVGLQTDDGRAVRVIAPGWWNHGEGPDFRNAQLEFNGKLRTGDVEIHVSHGEWQQHGHHLDPRYDNVLLHVVLESEPPNAAVMTAAGRVIPNLLLRNHLNDDIRTLADLIDVDAYPYRVDGTLGHCAAVVDATGPENLLELIRLAGEWRLLFKARTMREQMDRAGEDQAVYEELLAACGFSRYKHHFRSIAQQLPYDRARQLAQEDPLLLEAALLQLAGLLPDALPEGTTVAPHYTRLRGMRRDRFDGLRSLPLEWNRGGVRPTNNPERRLAGAARLIGRTAADGLVGSLERVWAEDLRPVQRRKKFEALFPRPIGFWANHCTWGGKKLPKPTAMLGPGRVRSIIGNVFVPAALALARRRKERIREEQVFAFFAAFPKEPDNQVQKVMLPRLFGPDVAPPKLDFRMQQGLLQLFRDWCEPNPSCRNCRVGAYLDLKGLAEAARRTRCGD